MFRLILNIGKLKLPDFARLAPELIPLVHLSAWRWDEKLFKKSDFYYENYDFQDEKQVLYNCPKMALRAKITTSIWLHLIFMM